MTREFQMLRAVFALVAALFLAAGSLVAPVSELTEEMHHAAAHADDGGDESADTRLAADTASGQGGHHHPDTPGHTHCGAGCHVQLPETRVAVAIAYSSTQAPAIAADEHVRPAAHLDGLFRPPRA